MFDYIKNNPLLFIVIFLAIVAPSFLLGAMKFVFILILIIVVAGALFIWSLRSRMSSMQREAQEQFKRQGGGAQYSQQGQGYKQNSSSSQSSGEPKVKIYATKSMREKRVATKVGDYVDFEVVKESDKDKK